mgnify:CR=1 FL=1
MNKNNYPQRKTTLKWNCDGELSQIDMLRVLEKISSTRLNQSELTCDSNVKWFLIGLLKTSNYFKLRE